MVISVRKRALRTSFITIAICLIAVSAQAQTLWGPTSYGMSPTEVLRVVQGAHPVENGSTLGGKHKAKELLRIDDYEVVNESFKVRFYFSQNRLVQVTLSLNEERRFDLALIVFDELCDALRTKYGKEISKRVIHHSLISATDAEAKWINGQTNIDLLVSGIGNTPAVFNLNYQVRLSKEANKL